MDSCLQIGGYVLFVCVVAKQWLAMPPKKRKAPPNGEGDDGVVALVYLVFKIFTCLVKVVFEAFLHRMPQIEQSSKYVH